MDIENTEILVHKSVYWIGMYVDIENHIKQFYMSSLSANTTMRENNTSQHTWQILGSTKNRHVYIKCERINDQCTISTLSYK